MHLEHRLRPAAAGGCGDGAGADAAPDEHRGGGAGADGGPPAHRPGGEGGGH